MNLSKEAIMSLDRIGATARFHMNPEGVVVCEVIDRTTNEAYATGAGLDREQAVTAAVQASYSAPKPLTKAQKEGLAFAADTTAQLQAENEKLKAELAAARAAPKTRKTSLATAE